MSSRQMIVIAILLIALAIVSGAFGAHGLKALVSVERLDTWQTAVSYNMSQGLGLLVMSLMIFVECG